MLCLFIIVVVVVILFLTTRCQHVSAVLLVQALREDFILNITEIKNYYET